MKKLASLILVLVLSLTVASAALADKVAVICDPIGTNLFLTQVED